MRIACFCIAIFFLSSIPASLNAQYDPAACGFYTLDGDELPCGMYPKCCIIQGACNGPGSPFQNYDPDYASSGGCAIPDEIPIDSGIWLLLLGGGFLGSMLILRRRVEAFTPQS